MMPANCKCRIYLILLYVAICFLVITPLVVTAVVTTCFPEIYDHRYATIFIFVFDFIVICIAIQLWERRERVSSRLSPVHHDQDVEASVEDNPPDYEDVISKAPPYEIIVMQDMRRFPGTATVSVLPPERAPLTPHGHGGCSGTGAVDENIDPELPTYQEALVGISGETKL